MSDGEVYAWGDLVREVVELVVCVWIAVFVFLVLALVVSHAELDGPCLCALAAYGFLAVTLEFAGTTALACLVAAKVGAKGAGRVGKRGGGCWRWGGIGGGCGRRGKRLWGSHLDAA